MRLIDTESLDMRNEVDLDAPNRPEYVVLSHTWGKDELSLQDFERGVKRDSQGWRKVEECCRLARERAIRYAWIDTVCIDKTNPMELTEAIQSMFRWYEGAQVCLAYLSDFAASAERGAEMLAPAELIFLDAGFGVIGSLGQFVETVHAITAIPEPILTQKVSFRTACVAQRMSWISRRKTTRAEDIAYCLLGIFDVHMPLFYGEGRKNAFMRLQENIIARSNDDSIFAWTSVPAQAPGIDDPDRGILAEDPSEFMHGGGLALASTKLWKPSYNLTNRGVELHVRSAFSPTHKREMQVRLNCITEQQSDGTTQRSSKISAASFVHIKLRRDGDITDSTPWVRIASSSLSPNPRTGFFDVIGDEILAEEYKVIIARSSLEAGGTLTHAIDQHPVTHVPWLRRWWHIILPCFTLLQCMDSALTAFRAASWSEASLDVRARWMVMGWALLALGCGRSGLGMRFPLCIFGFALVNLIFDDEGTLARMPGSKGILYWCWRVTIWIR